MGPFFFEVLYWGGSAPSVHFTYRHWIAERQLASTAVGPLVLPIQQHGAAEAAEPHRARVVAAELAVTLAHEAQRRVARRPAPVLDVDGRKEAAGDARPRRRFELLQRRLARRQQRDDRRVVAGRASAAAAAGRVRQRHRAVGDVDGVLEHGRRQAARALLPDAAAVAVVLEARHEHGGAAGVGGVVRDAEDGRVEEGAVRATACVDLRCVGADGAVVLVVVEAAELAGLGDGVVFVHGEVECRRGAF